MPILHAEPAIFPEDLWEQVVHPPEDHRWWAIYTKARQEKAFARQMLAMEIPFFLPLVPRDHLIRGRRIQSSSPLFAGYVFLFGTDAQRVQGLTTNRVSRVLPVPDQRQLVDDLTNLHTLIQSGTPLAAETGLEEGRRVRITGGPLRGIEGTVVTRRGQTRLLVSITFLQRGASVEIDDLLVEPII